MAGTVQFGRGLAANTAATRLSRLRFLAPPWSAPRRTAALRQCARYLIDYLGAKTGIAGEVSRPTPRRHVRRAGSGPTCHMRLSAPSVLEFGAEGDEIKMGSRAPVRASVKQLPRGRIDPMSVLKNHQNGQTSRESFELAEQRVEQHLSFSLRAEVEIGGGTRQ